MPNSMPAPCYHGVTLDHLRRIESKPPALVTETKEDPCGDQEDVEWLRSGKQPKARKSN